MGAELADRYEDMCEVMKMRVEDYPNNRLDTDERNLLSVAYKNVIGGRRGSWRTMASEYDEEPTPPLLTYKEQVETELVGISKDVLALLENTLIDKSDDKFTEQAGSGSGCSDEVEAQVFYLKMAGDYYRYLTESVADDHYKQSTSKYYGRAMKIAEACLPETHPIRLGLALNYSVCYYEILKQPQEACQLAKSAFDDAISKLDTLEEADYKDSTLIMQLLRDNLTLWTSTDGNEDVVVEDVDDN